MLSSVKALQSMMHLISLTTLEQHCWAESKPMLAGVRIPSVVELARRAVHAEATHFRVGYLK
jgi:hypothetical protein